MALIISKTKQTNYFNLLYNSIKRIPYKNSIDLSNGIIYTSNVDLDKYTYFIKKDFICSKEMLNCDEYYRIKPESPILSILAIDGKLIISIGLIDNVNVPIGASYACTITNNEQLINILNEEDLLDIDSHAYDLANKLKKERKAKIAATKLKNKLNSRQK